MSDQIFYVGAQDDDHPLTGYVPAKFLMRNGMYVTDPMPGGSQNAYLYSDNQGNNKTQGSVANPNNYLIVPAGYSEQKARAFAGRVAGSAAQTDPETGKPRLDQALAQMIGAFVPGGPQDLQRHPQWGIPQGSIVPAFIGSASNHLGYVTALAGIPMDWSEIGGGFLNGVKAGLHHFTKSRPIDTDGPYWLSKQNHANIVEGYKDGLSVQNSNSPFNDYGYGARRKPSSTGIGDGNGISPFSASLAGINSDEPTPPNWPPQQNGPVRYLSRTLVRY